MRMLYDQMHVMFKSRLECQTMVAWDSFIFPFAWLQIWFAQNLWLPFKNRHTQWIILLIIRKKSKQESWPWERDFIKYKNSAKNRIVHLVTWCLLQMSSGLSTSCSIVIFLFCFECCCNISWTNYETWCDFYFKANLV